MIARAPDASFEDRLEKYRQRANTRLESALSHDSQMPVRLLEAMRYSVLGGGKRVRPLLGYASGELFGIAPSCVDAIAASVELVHAYSLIHDDLPAMDDDDLRRGRPTTHRAFDEATAILAGDALQALAFETLCRDSQLAEAPQRQIRVIQWLAEAIGASGMVGGQALDLEAEGHRIDERGLQDIHRRKTGQLIRAAIMMPSELADIDSDQRARLDTFASEIGLVFQIRDDLLEVEQDTQTLGKNASSDSTNEKSTYPSVLGIAGARAQADRIHAHAMEALNTFGPASAGLAWLAELILTRNY
ncbi:MAG TPA: farnesyl diphosphate synthase [Gammaproteobacteria bacterium]|nr:farnesyl diphosphate synthase [Gammaproteobacteria bacterium]